MTRRWLPDCPVCDEPMYVRDVDLEEEPWFLSESSVMHHACLVTLKSEIATLGLRECEADARVALARHKQVRSTK